MPPSRAESWQVGGEVNEHERFSYGPRWPNAITIFILVLRQVHVGFRSADQSQPLLLRRLDTRLTFLGGARQALAVDARRVGKHVIGP